MKTSKLIRLVLLTTAIACSDSSGPKTTVAGSWTGNASTSTGIAFGINVVLVETAGAVTGTGTLTSPGLSVALSATGTYSAPTLGLTLSAPGFQSMNMTATVSQKTMTGTLNGSGFINAPITFTKP